MLKALLAGCAVLLSLPLAACGDDYAGGGRRTELPSSSGSTEPDSGTDADDDPGSSDPDADPIDPDAEADTEGAPGLEY